MRLKKLFTAMWLTIIWPLLVLDWKYIAYSESSDWRWSIRAASEDVHFAWSDVLRKTITSVTKKEQGL